MTRWIWASDTCCTPVRVHRLFSIAAWVCLTFVAFATLSPYAWRLELTETEGAFAVLGFLFVASYPGRPRSLLVAAQSRFRLHKPSYRTAMLGC